MFNFAEKIEAMTTLQFEVQDEYIKLFGLEKIKKIIAKELAYQHSRLLREQVSKRLNCFTVEIKL